MGLVGADVEQMRALARTLTQAADRLEGLAGEMTGRLSAAPWTGPDFDRYRSQWHGESLAMIRGVVGSLRAAAVTVDRNAAEQDEASTGAGLSGSLAGGVVPSGGEGPPFNPLVSIRDFLQNNTIWPINDGMAFSMLPHVGQAVPLLDALGLASDSSISAEDKIIQATNSMTDLGGGLLKDMKLGWPGYLAGVAVAQWGDVAAQVAKADFSSSTMQTTVDYIASDPGGAFDAAKDAVLGYVPKLLSNLMPGLPK